MKDTKYSSVMTKNHWCWIHFSPWSV